MNVIRVVSILALIVACSKPPIVNHKINVDYWNEYTMHTMEERCNLCNINYCKENSPCGLYLDNYDFLDAYAHIQHLLEKRWTLAKALHQNRILEGRTKKVVIRETFSENYIAYLLVGNLVYFAEIKRTWEGSTTIKIKHYNHLNQADFYANGLDCYNSSGSVINKVHLLSIINFDNKQPYNLYDTILE